MSGFNFEEFKAKTNQIPDTQANNVRTRFWPFAFFSGAHLYFQVPNKSVTILTIF